MTFLNRKFSSLKAGLLALGFAITTQNAQADTSAETNMKFGVTIDGSLARRPFMEKNKIAGGLEIRPTLFFEYKFADWFGVRTGIGYAKTILLSQLKSEELEKGKTKIDAFNLHMLSVPVVARFYPGAERKFSVYIGPRFGWIIGGKKYDDVTIDNYQILGYVRRDINSDEKKFQLLLDFGLDYETDFGLFFGMEGIGLALGYNFGALL